MPTPTLSQVHIQAALSDLSIAYRQDAPAVSDLVFRRVPVDKQSNYFFVWSKADMWRRQGEKRAPGAAFPRIGVRLSNDTYKCVQAAIEYPIPDEIRANQDAAVDIEFTAAMTLVDQLNLEKDLDFAADFFATTSGWASGTVSTAWDNVSSGTPVTNISAGARDIRRALGASSQHEIVGLGGTKILNALLTSDQVRDRTKYVTAQTQAAIEASLAGVCGLDRLVISSREYNTAKARATASYSAVFDNDFLIVAVPRNPGINVPAAGYSFAWNEGGRGDMYMEMYRDEDNKQDVVRALCYYDQKQTSTDLGVFFSNAVT